MSKSDFFSKLYRGSDRRTPMNEELGRRIASQCGLGQGSKVADLVCGSGALARLFAKDFGAEVTCADADDAALTDVAAAARSDKLEIKTVSGNPAEVNLGEGAFQAVVVESGRAIGGSVKEAAEKVRRFLVQDGRLALVARARVGLSVPETVQKFFEEKAEPLKQPRDLLQELEQAGFEPLSAEVFPDALLDEYWQFVEGGLGGVSDKDEANRLKREIEIYRREGGRTAVNTLVLVARRREPGERPPPARGEE